MTRVFFFLQLVKQYPSHSKTEPPPFPCPPSPLSPPSGLFPPWFLFGWQREYIAGPSLFLFYFYLLEKLGEGGGGRGLSIFCKARFLFYKCLERAYHIYIYICIYQGHGSSIPMNLEKRNLCPVHQKKNNNGYLFFFYFSFIFLFFLMQNLNYVHSYSNYFTTANTEREREVL